VLPCGPNSDQPFWGDILQRLSIGPAGFPIQKITPAKLAQALDDGLVNLDGYTQHAKAIAEKIAAENGVENCLKILQPLVKS